MCARPAKECWFCVSIPARVSTLCLPPHTRTHAPTHPHPHTTRHPQLAHPRTHALAHPCIHMHARARTLYTARQVKVVATCLSHHIRLERERYQSLGKATFLNSRLFAQVLDSEVFFLFDTLSCFIAPSAADDPGADGAISAAVAQTRSHISGWLADCGVSSAAAAAARKPAVREAAFRSGLLISCFSIHK